MLISGINSVLSTQTRPYPGSLLSLTSKGEICIFDPTATERSGLDATEKRTQNDWVFTQSINVGARPLPIVHSLENGFSVDSSLFIQVKLDEDAARLGLNLASGRCVHLIKIRQSLFTSQYRTPFNLTKKCQNSNFAIFS